MVILNKLVVVVVSEVPQYHACWVVGVVMPREACWMYVRFLLKVNTYHLDNQDDRDEALCMSVPDIA